MPESVSGAELGLLWCGVVRGAASAMDDDEGLEDEEEEVLRGAQFATRRCGAAPLTDEADLVCFLAVADFTADGEKTTSGISSGGTTAGTAASSSGMEVPTLW